MPAQIGVLSPTNFSLSLGFGHLEFWLPNSVRSSMFIVTECEDGELRQEFHVHRSQQTHFTPGGVRIASNASAINMQPLRGCRQTEVCRTCWTCLSSTIQTASALCLMRVDGCRFPDGSFQTSPSEGRLAEPTTFRPRPSPLLDPCRT
jgi:hypothetical protein